MYVSSWTWLNWLLHACRYSALLDELFEALPQYMTEAEPWVYETIPRIRARIELLAGGAEVEFRLLFGLGLWVVMRRAKQHTPAARMKKCAGRLAVPGGDTGGIAGLKIDRVNLVERIAYLAFALENQSRAVRAVVTLAAAPPFKGQLPHAGEELHLSLGESRAWPSGDKQGGGNGAGR